MIKGFVTFVFLSIGVVYGFILPLGTSELDLMSESSKDNVINRERELKITTSEPDYTKQLPLNRSDIDENALYEHATVKQNNQSERAFIYINQKYKKPSLHQYFRLAQSGPEFSRSFHMPPPLPQAFIQRRNDPCKSETEHVNSYYHGYSIPYKSPDVPSYFLPAPDCNFKDTQNILISNENAYSNYEKLPKYNKQNNMRRDFLELLKPPLLRPSDAPNVNIKYDGISGSRFSFPNRKDFPYYQTLKNEHNAKANILVDERKTEKQNYYGFGSYARHPTFQNRGMIQRIEEAGFDGELINDEPTRFLEKSQYEDKLLDHYLRDALGEQVTSKEKEIINNECSYPECVLQSAKTSSSITPQKDIKANECKCGQPLIFKQKVNSLPKYTPERRDKPCNKINNTPQRPDIAYFKEMVLQNKNPKTLNHPFGLYPTIKYNNTLYQ